MASSFASQIPVIVHLMSSLAPASVLDIGKGFGKYGFLLHEYCGIDTSVRPNPAMTLGQQSRVTIDAVESNPDYMWPHLADLYRKIFTGRIERLYTELPQYDLVLMADVIEHLNKEDGFKVVSHFVRCGAAVIVSTPRNFFHQELFESSDEHHLSHWTPADFRSFENWDYQNAGAGRVYLISPRPFNITAFGNAPVTRLRRLARTIRYNF
jgi:hypothetical protein